MIKIVIKNIFLLRVNNTFLKRVLSSIRIFVQGDFICQDFKQVLFRGVLFITESLYDDFFDSVFGK